MQNVSPSTGKICPAGTYISVAYSSLPQSAEQAHHHPAENKQPRLKPFITVEFIYLFIKYTA